LVFDEDLRRYKVLGGGEVAFTFGPLQVKDVDYDVSGKVKKRMSMGIYVNYPNGDEYLFDIEYGDENQFKSADAFIVKTLEDEKGRQEVLRLLKSREKITVDEVAKVLVKHGMPKDVEFACSLIDSAISTGVVQGTFNGSEFMSNASQSDVSVRYDIAVKLEFSASGALTLKCPGCGSAIPLEKKESNVKCSYCGQNCFVPRKVLELI